MIQLEMCVSLDALQLSYGMNICNKVTVHYLLFQTFSHINVVLILLTIHTSWFYIRQNKHSQPSGLFWIHKNKLFAMSPGKLHHNGLLCMQELNLRSHKFFLTYDWHISSFV